uniref:Ubiquitin-like protease family profile domain-containing protein n=1 Tax=Oryza glumipatula TaxID=40148 RepID=A0A0D9Y8B2_9ORYZ
MGALTDSRKRLSADHRLLPSFPPSPPPPSKKPKLAPLPSSSSLADASSPPPSPPPPHLPSSSSAAAPGSSSSSAAAAGGASTSYASSLPPSRHRRLPPPPPHPRPIHGPQRVLRAFRLGSALSRSNPSCFTPSPSSPRHPRSLGLEQYVELVNSVAHPQLPPPSPSTADSPSRVEVIAVDDAEERKDEEEAREEEEVKGSVVVRRVPLYKELYEASSRRRDAKLRALEFEVRLAEKGRLGLEQLADVLPRFGPRKEDEPFVPFTDEDEDSVDHALGGRNRCERLVVHESSNIVITRETLQCLNETAWLNDEVINLYLELLKERELREPNKFLKCHFFNTFFYKKLITGGYDYKSVRRWTTKRKLGYSLLECDKIFVPIHKEVHWCLAVINIRDKKFQFLDSLGSMDMKALRTLLLGFVSIRENLMAFEIPFLTSTEVMARYLVDEVKDKSGQHIDALSWKQEGVKNLPLQENGWDCGMFMLKYIDFYSRDMGLTFGQKHMHYFRKRTAKEILNLRAE